MKTQPIRSFAGVIKACCSSEHAKASSDRILIPELCFQCDAGTMCLTVQSQTCLCWSSTPLTGLNPLCDGCRRSDQPPPHIPIKPVSTDCQSTSLKRSLPGIKRSNIQLGSGLLVAKPVVQLSSVRILTAGVIDQRNIKSYPVQ